MAKKKKSRKIGLIGVRKTPDFKRVEKEKRFKKALGNPAGNRNNLATTSINTNKAKNNNDPRLGSKKPVALIVTVEESHKIRNKTLVKSFSPESELAQIENDERFALLVDKVDSGDVLDKNEQLYVTKNLQRHKELCELLGLTNESELDLENGPSNDENDLYDKFEKIDVNKLNDY